MIRRESSKIVFVIVIVWLLLVSIILIGCGGGGGDSTQVEPTEPATKEQLLQAIETTVKALEQEAVRGASLEKLSVANQLSLILDRDDIHLIPAGAQDECMTVETRDQTTILRFDGTAQCNGYSGALEITPAPDHEPDRSIYVNNIKLVDFSTGDGSPVNGEVQSKLTVQGQFFTDDSKYRNLDVCGRQFAGQVLFSGENWQTKRFQLNTREYGFDDDTKAQVDVVWQIDTSTLEGESLATVDNRSLPTEVNKMTFVSSCNLPTSGSLTIKDPAGGITETDFSNTTCEDPETSVSYNGIKELWPLEARKEEEGEGDPIVASVRIIGQEEMVFDWSEDNCVEDDIPDSQVCAFRDNNEKINLISTHYDNRRMIGDRLDTVKKDCNLILDSERDPDPSKYNDHEWINATYTSDGKTIYALVHNESHGWKDDEKCPSGEKENCLNYSITLAISTDGGKTYEHAPAPNHLVATPPYAYETDNSPAGYHGYSNIIFNSRDHWYYLLFRAEEFELQKYGVCAMRTKDLSDPKSWRAWDGNGFNVHLVNPFEDDISEPANHVCEPVSFDALGKISGYVSYNTYFKKYLLVGAGRAWNPDRMEAVPGYYFSLSDDLINWAPLQLIREVEMWYTAENDVDRYGYASLLDPDDTSRNFEVTGQRPYLYFVKWYKYTRYNRDLIRIQLEFSK